MAGIRRPWQLRPGEPLLLCRSVFNTATRHSALSEDAGIPEELVLSDPLCAAPLPVYQDFGTHEDGRPRRRWEGTRAEFMWHPLMWLPNRVSGRYELRDPSSGEVRLEDDETWAIRVAFELVASGLYDPDSGTWLDVLSVVGLDIEDDLDLARVEDWLAGYPDEVLDLVDLSDYMTVEPATWALETAVEMHDVLKEASWALIADDLLTVVQDVLETGDTLDGESRWLTVTSIGGLGATMLSDLPAGTAGGDVPDGAEDHSVFFEKLRTAAGGAQVDEELVNTLLEETSERLYAIRDSHWGALEAIGADSAEDTDEAAGGSDGPGAEHAPVPTPLHPGI